MQLKFKDTILCDDQLLPFVKMHSEVPGGLGKKALSCWGQCGSGQDLKDKHVVGILGSLFGYVWQPLHSHLCEQ